MKKKANRRAFFVCAVICLLYVSVAAKIPEKISFKRISEVKNAIPKNMSITNRGGTNETVEKATHVKTHEDAPSVPKKAAQRPAADENQIEPSLFISVPLVCFALKERLIDKDGLIAAEKDSKSNVNWKKPIDILKDKDEEGLKNLSRALGSKNILNFLKEEGITFKEKLSDEDMILGKGYFIEKKKLLAIYGTHVTEDYNRIFPFVVSGKGIVKHNGSYALVQIKTELRSRYAKDDQEWMMPNLISLPSKAAIEKLVIHTSKIKVMGSGNIVEQSPKPFERIRGETECVIYGRTYK
jgi:hypothetical protein